MGRYYCDHQDQKNAQTKNIGDIKNKPCENIDVFTERTRMYLQRVCVDIPYIPLWYGLALPFLER
jgi:hypothetical protein